MTLLLALLALLACKDAAPPPDSEADDTAPVVDTEAPDPRPWFANPAEAEDLDPAEGVVRVALTAATHWQEVVDPLTGDAVSFQGYAYNGQTPGPTLRAKLGDTLIVEFTNDLTAATTIHWHGLAVPYEMDGVTWTLDPVEPGETFTYTLPLTRAGTFWYHPHLNTDQQVDNGLYGVLIVEDPADPPVDRELVMVLDDWAEPEVALPPHGADSDDHGVDGAEGLWAVNGLVSPRVAVEGGEVVRVRLLNAANGGYVDLGWDGGVRQIAGDQGLLPGLATGERVVLAPGDRVDVEWLPGEAGFEVLDHPYAHSGGPAVGEPRALMAVEVDPPAAPAGAPAWPFPADETPDDPGYTDHTYVFTGELEGPWLINGEAFPDVTVAQLPLGEPSILEVRNLSASEHPFHLHGMHFDVLSINGEPPLYPMLEDTFNLGIRDALRVRVVPEYPGFWMLHCHILPHADGGMMTVVEVSE
ncbi:MAG: multicopper oxidase family protein [Alphaproteobacteria bacterium]|nr:multicopper oxidase family protein [Alphaproteobacteria bacterium]